MIDIKQPRQISIKLHYMLGAAVIAEELPVDRGCGPAGIASSAHAAASVDAAARLLDDPQEWAAFSRDCVSQPGWVESSLVIEGMTCSACAVTIEQALCALPGVQRADVSAASNRATVIWSPEQVQPSDWMGAIRRAGYQPMPANDSSARAARRQESRAALWRLLVAGLCMMQVMMYAYPAYVALPGDLSAESERLLRWASWVLTLPVVLFSCGPFFRNALRDLMQWRISMDLPVAVALVITFSVSSAGTFDPQGPFGREVFFDSLTMFVFFLLTGRWLEVRLRERTAGALEAMVNRMPEVVQRKLADSSFEPVVARRLRVGDIVRVHPGEAIPADGVIVRGSTQVDQSVLTGESTPIACGAGAAVIAGSYNLSAAIEVRVEQVGEKTRFAAIVALVHSAATAKPRLALLADRIAKPFLVGVLLTAAATAAFWWSQGPGQALMVAVAVLIVTCPCALSLATPTAMLAGAGSLARAGVLVRRLQALEALAAVDSIVFDKTGTLTRDVLRVDTVAVRAGLSTRQALEMAAALAQQSRHPVARALALAGASMHWRADDVVERPGEGLCGRLTDVSGGASIGGVRLGSARFCAPVTDDGDGATTYLCDAAGWLASFALAQDIRPDAAQAVTDLRRYGIAVHMLSGDRGVAAAGVAAKLGIESVQAECTPGGKLAFLRQLQADGHRVAMVGDGLNDAPVLAGADVSFAVGRATPLAQSQADFVVLGEQLLRVPQSVALARRTMRVVRQNLAWALAYNLACIPLAVAGWIPAWLAGLGMAASSLLVVLNALRLAGDLAPTGD